MDGMRGRQGTSMAMLSLLSVMENNPFLVPSAPSHMTKTNIGER